MVILLERELENAEGVFRPIAKVEHPVFEMPIERVKPDPNHKRHWYFATDNEKIKAHVYKPDYVLKVFRKLVAPMFREAYGFKAARGEMDDLAQRLAQDTFTYLLFHELFHPVFCPRSSGKGSDESKIDIALKNGIKRAEPHLSPRDIINKLGNCRNAMWDFLIDTFFSHYSRQGNKYEKHFRKIFAERDEHIGKHLVETVPDGIILPWDIIELADHPPQTMFYPVTRSMYSLLFCQDENLRKNVFSYFVKSMGRKISSAELEEAIVTSLQNVVKYPDAGDLRAIGIDKSGYMKAVEQLYKGRFDASGNAPQVEVVSGITAIHNKINLRYPSLEGIIEPLSKYISTVKEEKRNGADTGDEEGDGDGQTQPSQNGGGAEGALQNLLNEGDEDAEEMLADIANDQSAPQNNRNRRITNISRDEYYKRHAKKIPIKSPILEGEEKVVGEMEEYVKVSEVVLRTEELDQLNLEQILHFQEMTGLPCLTRISDYEWKYETWELQKLPILDVLLKKTGIILPDNIILRLDTSGSMTNSDAYVGAKNNRFNGLQMVAYGLMGAAVDAAKAMGKKVNVIIVNYSSNGGTIVSDPIDLVHYYETPNNPAKKVQLQPQKGSTYHDYTAYQLPYTKLRTKKGDIGKTLDIMIADGDLDSDHDTSLGHIRQICDDPRNSFAYFPIFQEGQFALRVKREAEARQNLSYKPCATFDKLLRDGQELIIQYEDSDARFGKPQP